jgi:hypothetical protein
MNEVVLILALIFVLHLLQRRPTVVVVVARYKEDTEWTKRVKYPCVVYEKENPENPYNIPVNKGHEASVYFKYIIDHYYKLPDYVIFVHGHESANHHKESIVNKLNSIKLRKKYTNLNDTDFNSIQVEVTPDKKLLMLETTPERTAEFGISHLMTQWWTENMAEYFGSIESLSGVVNKDLCCAQFTVSRASIQKNPLEFYQKQYNWLLTTDITGNYPAVMYEWTWKLIFN